ncbi:MAG: CDP-alcohol phosphatidyltransferase family protein, partial [Alphaproteobacteria bacterium]|nr:CDP-alcohol phosphatidyltransferase family protein [Alphaproteobacteria bacterium]
AVPVAVWLILSGDFAIAFWLFVVAAASDAVDGFIAKRFHMESALGCYLDPLADKALLVSVFLALGRSDLLPYWVVILVVSRDLLIIGGALLTLALGQQLNVTPALVSKINTVAQIALAGATLAQNGLDVGIPEALPALSWLVAMTTVLSGATYLVRWARGATETGGAG